MPRQKSPAYQQNQSERYKGQLPRAAVNPLAVLTLATTGLIQIALASTTDSASATNGNVRSEINVVSNQLSPTYCNFGDYFGCGEVNINLVNTTTNAALYFFVAGVNLQSTTKIVVTNGNSHTENAADSATLNFARECMQRATTYLRDVNASASTIVAQNTQGQAQLSCGWTSSANKNIYATVKTSSVSQQTCALLQSTINGLVNGCISEGSAEAAKLYALIALIAIPVVALAIMGVSKYKTGSFFALCKASPCCNKDSSFSNSPA